MGARTDTHRPSVLDPADYVAVGSFDDHDEEGYHYLDLDAVARVQGSDVADVRYADTGHAYGAVCQHCGHSLRYGEIFAHVSSGDLLVTGTTCATKLSLPNRDAVADRAEYRRGVMARSRGRRLFGDPAAAQAIDFAVEVVRWAEPLRGGTHAFTIDGVLTLDDEEGDRQEGIAWEVGGEDLRIEIRDAIYEGIRASENERRDALDLAGLNNFAVDFARSVWRRFERDATLSDKQTAVLLKLKSERPERTERAATRKAERESAGPVPTGRVEVEGVVVSRKFQENDFGGRSVMTVKLDNGGAVWGSIPAAISDAMVGDRIVFTATVERAPDRESFGFFKRPSKADYLERADEERALEGPTVFVIRVDHHPVGDDPHFERRADAEERALEILGRWATEEEIVEIEKPDERVTPRTYYAVNIGPSAVPVSGKRFEDRERAEQVADDLRKHLRATGPAILADDVEVVEASLPDNDNNNERKQ